MRTLILFFMAVSSLVMSAQTENAATSKPINPPFVLFISSKNTFALGSPIEMGIRIKNVSTHEIRASAMNIDGFAISYTYDIRDQSGNKVAQKPFDQTHPGGGSILILKPGQNQGESTVISAYYDLWPGRYTVQISKPVSDKPGAEVVRSNKISITVIP